MRLSDMLSDLLPRANLSKKLNLDMMVEGLTCDSRKVRPGYVFAAFNGTEANGAAYIKEATAKGACAVLAEAGEKEKADVPLMLSEQPRKTYAHMAARFFQHAPEQIVAVTGTNGKTSVAEFYRQIAQQLGQKAASLGTMGVTGATVAEAFSHTTPEPAVLHAVLRDLHFAGITHLAMEASSHGLSQFRMDGVSLRAAAFTNLTRDHLDYHQTQAAYFDAKARLFTDLLGVDGVAIINLDGAGADEMLAQVKASGKKVMTVGTSEQAQLQMANITTAPQGIEVSLRFEGQEYQVTLPIIGHFQVENIGCAVGLGLVSGFELADMASVLPFVTGAKGRLEKAGVTAQGATLYIDYAHTPDALEQVLTNLKPHCSGKIICVFGCGGDRDVGKRPEMGEVVARLADVAIVTDDNPRKEDPAAIRADVMTGCPDAENIADRAKAIAHGISRLGDGDILLIAGKGHENQQLIGDETLPFSDEGTVRAILRSQAAGETV